MKGARHSWAEAEDSTEGKASGASGGLLAARALPSWRPNLSDLVGTPSPDDPEEDLTWKRFIEKARYWSHYHASGSYYTRVDLLSLDPLKIQCLVPASVLGFFLSKRARPGSHLLMVYPICHGLSLPLDFLLTAGIFLNVHDLGDRHEGWSL